MILVLLAIPAMGQTGLRFVATPPCRLVDTRAGTGKAGAFGPPALQAGATRSFAIPQAGCGVPSSAQAYSLNVTVVPRGMLSYLTLFPAGQAQPLVSTLNSFTGTIVANAAIVPAGADGGVSVFVTDATDVILDIYGYFDQPGTTGASSFYTITPCRLVDTRLPDGALGGPSLAAGQQRSFGLTASPCGLPVSATAYSLNATVIPPGPLSYLTLWPSGGTQPQVSTLNSFQGKVLANAALVPAGAGGTISAFVTDRTDLALDGNGYFGPPGGSGALAFRPVTPCRLVDTRIATGTLGGPVLAAGVAREFPIAGNCGLPTDAQAYSLNVTVVPVEALAYLTVWPAGQSQPVVSTLNAFDGGVTANAALVPAGTAGAVSVFATNRTHVVIDANGYFAREAPPAGAVADPPRESLIPVSGGRIEETSATAALNGTAIEIPAAALTQPATISFRQSAASLPEGYAAAGPTVEFGPNQQQFGKAVTITLPYNDRDNDGLIDGTSVREEDLAVLGSNADGSWTEVSIISQDTTANIVRIGSMHFSAYATVLSTRGLTYWPMTSSNAASFQAENEPATISSDTVQYGVAASGSADGKTLRLFHRWDAALRIKQRSVQRVGPGIFQWRVWVPKFHVGSRVGVGAFLYADDQHELDFEVGYGTRTERGAYKVTSPNEGILYMTKQSEYAGCPRTDQLGCKETLAIPISLGAWHTFQLATRENGDGTTTAHWYVDGVWKVGRMLYYRMTDFDFRVYSSLEYLPFYGDEAIPTQDTTVYFDSISYTSSTQGTNVSDQQVPTVNGDTPGWTVIGGPATPPRLSQTFRPSTRSVNAVEVRILTGNPSQGSDTLVLRIRDASGRQLVSSSQFVPTGFQGWLRFRLNSIAVTPGEPLTLVLEQSSGANTFGWEYVSERRVGGVNTVYPNGRGLFQGQSFYQNGNDVQFLFRTFGEGETPLGLALALAGTSIPRTGTPISISGVATNRTNTDQRSVGTQYWIEQGTATYAAGGMTLTPLGWNGNAAVSGLVPANSTVTLSPAHHAVIPWGGTGASAGPATLVAELTQQLSSGRWSIAKLRFAVNLQ